MPTFTDKMLGGLKLPEGKVQDVIWDSKVPNFGIKVGKQAKTFFVGVRVKGRYRPITIGRYPDITLANARAAAWKIKGDAKQGIAPEQKKKAAEKGTFGAIADAFMTDYAKDHRTRGEMQRKINVELAAWHDVQITDIRRADIKELVRVKARSAPIAANRLLSLVSKIFNWALKEEYIEASPAMMIERPGKETERERSLSADEIKTAWAAFDKLGYPYGSMFKMLLVTGQRRGEVAGMKWTELTAEGWQLPVTRIKNGKGHLVPLSSLAREVLEGVPQMGELVFRSRNDNPLWSWSEVAKRLQRLCGDMEPWHLHDLRRTFATHLRSLGVDRLLVSKLLNHAEGGVTKVNDRYSADAEKTAAMERWANRLREIISGAPADNVVQIKMLIRS
jgi:integrase